jgi:hypothetical protein
MTAFGYRLIWNVWHFVEICQPLGFINHKRIEIIKAQ